jgi:hypothetical protein
MVHNFGAGQVEQRLLTRLRVHSQAGSLGLVGMTQSRLRVAATQSTVGMAMMLLRLELGMTKSMRGLAMIQSMQD